MVIVAGIAAALCESICLFIPQAHPDRQVKLLTDNIYHLNYADFALQSWCVWSLGLPGKVGSPGPQGVAGQRGRRGERSVMPL